MQLYVRSLALGRHVTSFSITSCIPTELAAIRSQVSPHYILEESHNMQAAAITSAPVSKQTQPQGAHLP